MVPVRLGREEAVSGENADRAQLVDGGLEGVSSYRAEAEGTNRSRARGALPVKILFVWSSAEFSTFDVARGYRLALDRQGCHDIRDYRLYARMRYHAAALGDERAANLDLLTRIASENVVVEAMKHRADVVFVISALALHPDAVWYLKRVGIPTAVLFTESPYDDAAQRDFHAVYPEMKCFTNERTSVVNGWEYVAHAYDPHTHYPQPSEEKDFDVLFVGTLWQSRIQLLEQVDWSGIKVALKGTWVAPPEPKDSSLEQFYDDTCVRNIEAPALYGRARICLNPHRAHPTAESLNPRAFELAACEAFQILDQRAETQDVFDGASVSFTSAEDLEQKVRWWLAHDSDRQDVVRRAKERVLPHTFDARLESILARL